MFKMMVLCGVVALVGGTGDARADKGKGAATLTAAADLKWADVPNMAGIKMAVADGDPAKGASHFYLKFDKGFTAGEHHHTADHSGTVVAGTLILTVDGKENRLPAGSFFAFNGKKVHATKCDAAADCILAMDARGKWDVVPEAAPKPDVKKPTK
jgi:quercetin dioxygenase-like cupin family protein